MTIGIKISVNGSYKLPVSLQQGTRTESFVISGRGHDGPNEKTIYFNHGPEPMTMALGPETPDNGEPDELVDVELHDPNT